jgi:hypothetical protein
MVLRLAVVLASLVAVGTAAAGVPTPIVETGFKSPSGNIACNAGTNSGKKLIACTLFSSGTPNKGDKVWAMFVRGRVQVGFVRGDPATDYPKLAYGRTWKWHGITCRSARSGLTCRNAAGHGFFLSRGSQRVF